MSGVKLKYSMSYLLPHLHSGFAVDQAILSVRPVLRAPRVECPRQLLGGAALTPLSLLTPSPHAKKGTVARAMVAVEPICASA